LIAAVHQPQFMPWLGYFDKMDRADCFVLLEGVQYKKNEWQNRNRIKGAAGPQWLTVPVRFSFPARIDEVAINQAENWRHRHWQALRTNYARAGYWREASGFLEEFYRREWQWLVEVNVASIQWLREVLGITTPLRSASQLPGLSDDPTGRLVDICRAVGAGTYLSGADGPKYLDLDQFADAGIEVIFQEYQHPVYPQLFGDFVSHLSALDLVLNCGAEGLNILKSGRR
jgi:hypothetical protein